MGGGSFSNDIYTSTKAATKASGKSAFGYSDDVKAGRASGVHEILDPSKMKNGVREARDSDEHPESLPITVIFDVTGSMKQIPVVLQDKLAKLMDVVKEKAHIEHPQVLVGAVGDSYSDQYPFQIGQFESDNKFDEQLRSIILEGNGGGQSQESYGLAYYFAAYCTEMDSLAKRGKKGYLFTMGDEDLYMTLRKGEIKRIFDTDIQEDLPVNQLLQKAQEKWEVYHLFSMDGSYGTATSIHEHWRALLGERFVKVEDSSLICEIIAGLVYGMETACSIDKIVNDVVDDPLHAAALKNALIPVMSSRNLASSSEGSVPAEHDSDKDEEVTTL